MTSKRELIYSTIFAALKSAVDDMHFRTCSRKTLLWTQVSPQEQPAIFMQQVQENMSMGSGREPGPPNKAEIAIDVVIYATAGQGSDDIVTPFLNEAIDRIEALFPPPPKNVQTLEIPGVAGIRIGGTIEYREGNLAGQGIAIVPLRVIAV